MNNNQKESECEDDLYELTSNEESDGLENGGRSETEVRKKKNYRVLTVEQLIANLQQLIAEVDVVLELGFENCLKLLQKYKYDKEKLLEREYTKDDVHKIINKIRNDSENSNYPEYCDRQACINDYVKRSRLLTWCPKDKGVLAIEVEDADVSDVECSCSLKFCFACKQCSHKPATCNQWSYWEKYDNVEFWKIMRDTKRCPNCRVRIQYDGYLKQMTLVICPNADCRIQLCWGCGVEWIDSHYYCEDYVKPPDAEEKEFCRRIERYFRYHELVTIQKDNHSLVKPLSDRLQQANIENLQETLDTLSDSFETLFYSYVLEFYFDLRTNKNVFKCNRKDFKNSILKLFEKLETMNGSLEERNSIGYLEYDTSKRRDCFLKYCSEAIKNGEWMFDEQKFMEYEAPLLFKKL